jgi:hypothetical protein
MARANIAEWILRRVVNPSRASEIVGDMLESRPRLSPVRFWFTIAAVLIALAWRSVVGVLAAAIASVLLSWLPFAYVFTHLGFQLESSFYSAHAGFYIFFGMLLWISAIYSLVCFGPRNPVAQLGLLSALLEEAATCTYWLPNAVLMQSVAATLLVVAALFTPVGRKVSGVLLPALVAGEAALYLVGKLPVTGRTPGFLVILLGLLLTVTIIECVALSFAHRRLARTAD